MILRKALRKDAKQEEIYEFFCREDVHRWLLLNAEASLGHTFYNKIKSKMALGKRRSFRIREYTGSDLGKTMGELVWQPVLGQLLGDKRMNPNMIFTGLTTTKTDKYDFCLNRYRIEFKTGQGSAIQGSTASDKSKHFLIFHYNMDFNRVLRHGSDPRNRGIITSLYIGMHFNWIEKKWFMSGKNTEKNHRTQLQFPKEIIETVNYGSCLGHMDFARKKDGSPTAKAKWLGFRDMPMHDIFWCQNPNLKNNLGNILTF